MELCSVITIWNLYSCVAATVHLCRLGCPLTLSLHLRPPPALTLPLQLLIPPHLLQVVNIYIKPERVQKVAKLGNQMLHVACHLLHGAIYHGNRGRK